MFKMFKNKKAQNTAEYAILIALVVGGVIAMQTYAQRTLQGRIRDANRYLTAQSDFGNGTGNYSTLQYEPYYTNTTAGVTKDSSKTTTLNGFGSGSNVVKTGVTERTEYTPPTDGQY